ncbi:DMT family transporter [Sinomonas sp. JC656]|uniref:DMT family transporter n=2 Tax=Sinomonas cellulolyticus TaxID=2801916 RepID=A0ABS1K398_9MICC|nr:DMT family transporter [Sinomonas cellulolyticus]
MTAVGDARVFSSTHWMGIPVALLGAVFLALGTVYQGRGVTAGGRRETSLGALARRPAWLLGTLMLGAAVVLQLTALRFSPLVVVQPLGAFALVVTVLAQIRASLRPPGPRKTVAILLCVAGIGAFVTVAALAAQDVQISDRHLRTILIVLAFAVAAALALTVRTRRRPSAVLATVGAGILYGFVATLAKAVIGRIAQGDFAWLSLAGLAGVAVALVLGAGLVQKAHATGSDELVVAGLTVVDPMVAVILGITVLGEADTAPPLAFAGFLAAGAVAVAGVWLIASGPQRRHAPGPGPTRTRPASGQTPPGTDRTAEAPEPAPGSERRGGGPQ